jgi:putative Holliday junction resolvase
MTSIDLGKLSSQLQRRLKPSTKRLYHTVALRGAQATVTENPNHSESILAESGMPEMSGRLLAIDVGTKRVGVALSDEMRLTVRALAAIERKSWKDLLRQVTGLVETWKVCGLVVGWPLSLDGSEGSAADSVRELSRKFDLSLSIPVYLQDERLTTKAAESHLKTVKRTSREIEREVDSEAAAIILTDFIESRRS